MLENCRRTPIGGLTDPLNRETAPFGAEWHALRTRVAGNRTFVTLHVLVPGDWSVHRGHELCEVIEAGVRALLPRATIVTHLEPLEDPRASVDQHLSD
jgi:divalent metal cation (Fe/Co/Zn/Cd) transporter